MFLKKASLFIVIVLSASTIPLLVAYYVFLENNLQALAAGIAKVSILTLLFTILFQQVECRVREPRFRLAASSVVLALLCTLSYTLNPWGRGFVGRVFWIELYTLASILYWLALNAGVAGFIQSLPAGSYGGVSGGGTTTLAGGGLGVGSGRDLVGVPLKLRFKKTIVSKSSINGYKIAGYTVRGFIGAGGLAATLLVEDENGVLYAAKIPRSAYEALSSGATVKASVVNQWFFEEKTLVLKKITHPHITRFYKCGVEYGIPYVIVEYCENGSLRGVLEVMGKVGFREALEIGVQVADALSYMHSLGVVHGDLKPENILFDREGVLKISDILYPEVLRSYEGGGLFYTIGYASPEQVFSSYVSEYSDVWSLGVILYELLTGRKPFRVECYVEDLKSRRIDYTGIPKGIAGVIDQMLQLNPEYRPKACEARDLIIEALESIESIS